MRIDKPLVEGATDLLTACKDAGIELQGEEWHPFHCGERMATYSGLVGVDYSRCRKCGLELSNVASPHMNGGRVLDFDGEDRPFGELPVWVVTRTAADPAGE